MEEIERVKAAILNEGSIPQRKNLADELDMLSYKRGFREAEQQRDAQHKAELELAVIEARIDELNTMYGRITSEITVGGNNWPSAIRFRIDNRIEALTKGSK